MNLSLINTHFRNFSTGLIQVMLVCVNTWQIANEKYLGAIIVGFLISLVWTLNVRAAAFGTIWQRLSYCLGAATGTALGLTITQIIYK